MYLAYMHPYIGLGRATLAIEHSPATGWVAVGVSYSSPKDRFNRKKGRLIAEGRLKVISNYYFTFQKERDQRLKDAVYSEFLKFNDNYGPGWAKKVIIRCHLDCFGHNYVYDGLCPNCVTPWKCNGPHNPENF